VPARILPLALLLAALWATPARAELLVDAGGRTQVAAVGGTALVSEYHPSSFAWRLIAVPADASFVPIAAAGTAQAPWDADLGTDAAGRLVATWMDKRDAVVAPIDGGAAKRYRLVSRAVSPSMWKGRLAYARGERLYSGRPGGPYKERGRVKKYAFSDVDLGDGGAVALGTRGERTRVVLDGRTVASATGDGHTLFSPAWDGDRVVWAEQRPAVAGSSVKPCDCVQAIRPSGKLREPERPLCTWSPITGAARQGEILWVTDSEGRVWRLPPDEDLCF
jgi:hypothetical protein